MPDSRRLTIEYRTHVRVDRLIDVLCYTVQEIALGFDRWGESRVYGPGMYLAVVVGPSVETIADPMGENRWPEAATRDVLHGDDAFVAAAEEVAYTFDGAVLVSVDGIVQPQMVRFRMADIDPDLEYAPWMGARHMSALDVSTRSDVLAAITLSEETGRVTRFENGTYESLEREELGAPWLDDRE